MPPKTDKLSLRDAAARFGVDPDTLRQLCQPGRKLAPYASKLARSPRGPVWVLTVPEGAGVEWYRSVVGKRRGRGPKVEG